MILKIDALKKHIEKINDSECYNPYIQKIIEDFVGYLLLQNIKGDMLNLYIEVPVNVIENFLTKTKFVWADCEYHKDFFTKKCEIIKELFSDEDVEIFYELTYDDDKNFMRFYSNSNTILVEQEFYNKFNETSKEIVTKYLGKYYKYDENIKTEGVMFMVYKKSELLGRIKLMV